LTFIFVKAKIYTGLFLYFFYLLKEKIKEKEKKMRWLVYPIRICGDINKAVVAALANRNLELNQ
jgi:hypothetical protein